MIPESVFCEMTEQIYNALVTAIEMAITLPVQFLESIKSAITRIEMLLVNVVAKALNVIENKILAWLSSKGLNPDDSETKQNFCAMLFACEALKDSLFVLGDDTGDSDAIFVKSIPLSVRNAIRGGQGSAYETFELYVCKLSLRGIIDEYISTLLLGLSEELTLLRQQILDYLNIDQFISQYEEFLQKDIPGLNKNIYELMAEIDKFAQCAFGVCNFVTTSANQKKTYMDKLYLQESAPGQFVVNLKGLTQNMDENGEFLLNKINDLESFILKPETTPNGVSKEEVMLK